MKMDDETLRSFMSLSRYVPLYVRFLRSFIPLVLLLTISSGHVILTHFRPSSPSVPSERREEDVRTTNRVT